MQQLMEELLQVVLAELDVETLLCLARTSRRLHELTQESVEARCKHECLSTYLHPTIAAYRMLARVPTVSPLGLIHALVDPAEPCGWLVVVDTDVEAAVCGVRLLRPSALGGVYGAGYGVVLAVAQVGQPGVRDR